MAEKLKIRIPLIVTADGRWGASIGHTESKPDWPMLEEMCDWENALKAPQRYWVTVEVELPVDEVRSVSGKLEAEAA